MDGDREILIRIGELERKVDHLYRHLTGQASTPASVPPLPAEDESISPGVRQLVADGNTIEAIKLYRAETGVDLATAKHRVDQLG